MDSEEFDEIFRESQERRAKMMGIRGQDYDESNDDQLSSFRDRLSSFREVAAILNILHSDGHDKHTASGVAEVLLVLKLVRDFNLKHSEGEVEGESRRDNQDDAHNYLDLRYAIEWDQRMRDKESYSTKVKHFTLPEDR